MLSKILKWIGLGLSGIVAILFLLWATSDDPKGNPATFEPDALQQTLLPLSDAITLAFAAGPGDLNRTLLVLDYDETGATVLDLSELGATASNDPFAALSSVSETEPLKITVDDPRALRIQYEELLPAAGAGEWHLATGTNFPEHAEEALSDSVFNFPKFGAATPPRTQVAERSGMLLDYEVELCARFDRPIKTAQDFDAARKGFFLCGDFTDRVILMNLVDTDNLDSGTGFSDAKSGTGFYPAGAFLVIPNDWEAFISAERMTTQMNGEPRQDARGSEMILDFRALATKALSDMNEPRFLYQSGQTKLAPNRQISPSMTMMSGTAEGVIFTTPSRGDMIEGVAWHLFSGGIFQGKSAIDSVIDVFLENELESQHFLKPGDQIHYQSSSMGDIKIMVVDGDAP